MVAFAFIHRSCAVEAATARDEEVQQILDQLWDGAGDLWITLERAWA
jgi:hypothetical protein